MSTSGIQPTALTERDAATYLGMTERFLQARRVRGGGPRFVRISSRCVRYRRSDLDEWLADRVRTSTSDSEGATVGAERADAS